MDSTSIVDRKGSGGWKLNEGGSLAFSGQTRSAGLSSAASCKRLGDLY